jgi:hypothetical protein
VARSTEAPLTAVTSYDFAIQQTVMLISYVSYWLDSAVTNISLD